MAEGFVDANIVVDEVYDSEDETSIPNSSKNIAMAEELEDGDVVVDEAFDSEDETYNAVLNEILCPDSDDDVSVEDKEQNSILEGSNNNESAHDNSDDYKETQDKNDVYQNEKNVKKENSLDQTPSNGMMSNSPIHMLVVGSSEVAMWMKGQQFLKETYGIELKVDFSAGRRLEECVLPVRARMDRKTTILLIWSLTSWAWKRETIYNGGRTATVFRPDNSYSLDKVAPIMEQIVQSARHINPSCEVYLALPAVKDMYSFNQKRIVKAWGKRFEDVLRGNVSMGPAVMRNHSISSYMDFSSLIEDRAEYWWTSKKCLRGSFAIYQIFRHRERAMRKMGILPPHTLYLSGKSLRLNLSCLPDGLHGTQEFLEAFCRRHKRIFSAARIGPNAVVSCHLTIPSAVEEQIEESEQQIVDIPELSENGPNSPGSSLLSVPTASSIGKFRSGNRFSETESNPQNDSRGEAVITPTRPVMKWTPVVFDVDIENGSNKRDTIAGNIVLNESVPHPSQNSETFRIAWKRAVCPLPAPTNLPSPSVPSHRDPPLGTNVGGHSRIGCEISVSGVNSNLHSTSTDPRFLPTLLPPNEQRNENGLFTPEPTIAKIRAYVRKLTTRLIPSSCDIEVKRKILDEMREILAEEREILLIEDNE